ncbi:UNVERIFIED_CONTAM: hypothetical protein HDU68_004357, partial [Siphonaria sp. JEL0065]
MIGIYNNASGDITPPDVNIVVTEVATEALFTVTSHDEDVASQEMSTPEIKTLPSADISTRESRHTLIDS